MKIKIHPKLGYNRSTENRLKRWANKVNLICEKAQYNTPRY